MMSTKAYTLSDCKINQEIMRQLQIPQIPEFVEYRRNWKQPADRMSSERILKKILIYQPKGKKNRKDL
jgi:hypothetical protein